jgi:hypothetical protein
MASVLDSLALAPDESRVLHFIAAGVSFNKGLPVIEAKKMSQGYVTTVAACCIEFKCKYVCEVCSKWVGRWWGRGRGRGGRRRNRAIV